MQYSSSTMLTTTRAKYNALVRSRWKPEIIGTSSGGRSLKSRYKPPQVSVWKSPQMVLPDISSTTSKSNIVPTIASTKEFTPSRATIPRVTLHRWSALQNEQGSGSHRRPLQLQLRAKAQVYNHNQSYVE